MKKVIKLNTGEDVLIRHIKESDIDGVWNNFNEVVDEGIYLPVLFPVRSEFEKQSWYNGIIKDNELCIVAIHSKLVSPFNVIGQCEISNLSWDAGTHVGNLGIIISRKFRNQGLGFFLIDVAIREAKAVNNKEKIILSCFSNNQRALHLYQKLGFQTVGVRKRQFYMDSIYYDEVIMEIWIDDYLKNHI
jgi:RimJ/RimL family protein N-acetyltransferase